MTDAFIRLYVALKTHRRPTINIFHNGGSY